MKARQQKQLVTHIWNPTGQHSLYWTWWEDLRPQSLTLVTRLLPQGHTSFPSTCIKLVPNVQAYELVKVILIQTTTLPEVFLGNLLLNLVLPTFCSLWRELGFHIAVAYLRVFPIR